MQMSSWRMRGGGCGVSVALGDVWQFLLMLPLYFSGIPKIVCQNSQVDLKISKQIKNEK